jgi:Zn-finger nucleic acid-binding protein
MPEAETRRCPVCGAPVKVGAPGCGYCGSELLTVRCAECFVMNAADGLRCSGCGRALGLEPLSLPSDLACPECRRPFSGFGGTAGRLSECTGCGGQFVEHALLRDLLERREVFHSALPRPPRENPMAGSVRYRPCPSCTAMMNRKNFGDSSGIVVDVCSKHGIWFDAGELPRVLAFVEAGGLERARRRKREDDERRAREARAQAVVMTPLTAQNQPVEWLDLGQAGLDLIDFLVTTVLD